MQHHEIAFVIVSFAAVFAAAYALSRLKQALLQLSYSISAKKG